MEAGKKISQWGTEQNRQEGHTRGNLDTVQQGVEVVWFAEKLDEIDKGELPCRFIYHRLSQEIQKGIDQKQGI